jgi:CheY-like chemotaxis protein
MKVLVVDPDMTRGPALKMGLAAGGAEVTVASSGSFALTMLEWNRHDIVVSRARIQDMDGHELCAILKSDPGMRDVRFVLIADSGEVSATQTTVAGVDLVVPPTVGVGTLVPLVLRLVEDEPAAASAATPPAPTAAPAAPRPPAPAAPRAVPSTPLRSAPAPAPVTPAAAPAVTAAPAPVAAPAPAPVAKPQPPGVPKLRPDPVATPVADPPKRYVTAAGAAAAAPWKPSATPVAPAAGARASTARASVDLMSIPSGTFQGSLEVMDLAELTQAIAMGGKNGRLILALPQGGGVIAFEAGQVVHAEYLGNVGEPAFAALLTAAHAEAVGRFCFLPSAAGETPSPSRTIDKGVDQLLLSIATAIDEKG